MTEALQTGGPRVFSLSPRKVRVSYLVSDAQVDITLPSDVPIVGLLPTLVAIVQSTDRRGQESSEHSAADTSARTLWILSRTDDPTPLPPDATLWEAGVRDGALLRLSQRAALNPPTLHDDVVDAAARLNRAGIAGWDAVSARWMTFAAVHLASLVWVYFLVAEPFTAYRKPLTAMAVVVVLALVGVASLANRWFKRADVGMVVGWAALPITAAVLWVSLRGFEVWGLAAACLAMLVATVAFKFCVGAGGFVYLAVQVGCTLTGAALLAVACGVAGDVAAVTLTATATLGCAAVSWLTARRFPFGRTDYGLGPTSDVVAVDDIWTQVRSAALVSSAVYAGFAVSACLAASTLLSSSPHWGGFAFAVDCAVVMGVHCRRVGFAGERLALAVPALALVVASCLFVRDASPWMSLVAFGILLSSTLAFTVVGFAAVTDGPGPRVSTLLAYCEYLASAAVIPLALWAVGVFGRMELA